MGSKLSIDKHVSSLEDILSTDPALFSSIQVENNIPDCTTQNIKIWRYYEDDTKSKAIKSAPISLEDVLNADFTFVSNECYLVLFVYRKNAEDTLPFNAFPASMWGLVESYSNLTPRGLETPVASSEPISSLNKEVLESFLLPKRNQKQDGDKFEHMLFVWNGKTANPLMKAIALSKALEFDTLIHKGKDPLLQVLFSGGYIKNKKLCAGNILQLDSSVGNQQNQDLDNRIDPMKETIYLMKFLFPANDPRSFKPSAFKERFLSSRPSEIRQDDEYVMMGDFPMELEEESEFVEESTPLDSPTSMSYGGRRGSEFDDFLPLESVRRDMGPPAAVPKLTLSITKTQNGNDNPVGAIGGFGQLVNNGGDSKFKIPNLRLGRLGEEAVNVEIKVETPVSEDAANESQERSEEVRQPASSDRTSESQDSRRRSERRIANRVQMSNLSLGTIEQPRVSEANQMANLAEINRQIHIGNYGGRESAIRGERQEFFAGQCSEVLEGFLYVAGIKIASNIKKLEEFGITHVINAAGDVCENFFSDKIKYLTYYIKDHPSESIECVFYETLAFIENARQEGGRVLVHCVQGVSRSVTICMSYLMLKHQYTFNQAYKYIRDIRGIASPNPAFWAQLCHFYNRLYGAFDTIPAPRVFTIGSYQKETPQTLVARLLPDSHSLYGQKNTRLLDPRSVVILQAQHSLYLWVGNEILPANRERYIAKAEEHIKLLQQYERAHPECLTIHCGEEPEEFWSLWENLPETRYGKNNDWNYWLVDLSAHKNVEGITIYEEQEEEDDSGEVEVVSTPSLFCYPKLEALKHADMDELSDEENLLVLCTEKENDKLVYVWRGANVPTNEIDNEAYIADVIKEKWPDTDAGEIKIFNEVPNQESNSFMDYFQ